MIKTIKNRERGRETKALRERERETDHSITPEAAESLRNSHRPEKASMENPCQVKGQPPKAV